MTPGLDVSLFVRGGALEIGVRFGQVRSGQPLPPAVLATPLIGIFTLHSLLFWCRGLPLRAPSLGSVGVACRRPLPWLGWGRPGRPLPLCLLVVGAPVGVPSVGGLLPSSFPLSGGPPGVVGSGLVQNDKQSF